ncbi:oligosaccharide flippase family protein [Candidatus Gracilibacteria bacterium]|nr:oligosaccharide flippase family protein [Candidatus Gracilibacteria bacterium]
MKPKSEFNRNILTLMTGTIIAQAIPIAISPLLTRIYSPDDFGIFALYMSIISILAVIATGRYELAIILPEKDEDAINLIALSMILVSVFCFFVFILVLVFNDQIVSILKAPNISSWLYFTPISIFFMGLYQNLNSWINRKKQYKKQALSKVVQNATIGSSSLGLGFSGIISSGLIMGLIAGQGVVASFLGLLTWRRDKSLFKKINSLQVIHMGRKYIDFPKYDIAASLSSVSSQQIVHILFNSLFGSTTAGYYYLTQRMLGAPISFLASAILDVFKQKAAKDYKKHGNAKVIYKSTFKKLLVLSIIPTTIIYFFAIDIFVFMFGENWKEAGIYAQILAPMLLFRFLANPLSFMLYIANKQIINLYTQLLSIIILLLLFVFFDSAKDIIIYMSFLLSAFYISHIIISAYLAGVFDKN